ncbi:MAG: YqiJ family protein [Pseudomonadota bacterium]
MVDFLLLADNLPFTVALILMLLIGVVEAAGLGGIDLDLDGEADGHALSWLGLGRLPLLALIVVLLASFGMVGLFGQRLLAGFTGSLAPWWLAVPSAALASLPLTSLLSRAVARILPRDETTAIHVDELIGRYATVTVGRAAAGSPARARVQDRFGQDHYVMVEPDSGTDIAREGERLLLVRRDGDRFAGILDVSGRLPSSTLNPIS